MLTSYLSRLVSEEIQKFIFENENVDENELVLKHKEIKGLPSSIIANQIAARRKAKLKLPLWYKTKGIIYPPSLNLQQSSSQATAMYKRKIIEDQFSNRETKLAVDLTGGYGVDTFHLSSLFKEFHYVEPNDEMLHIAKHNLELLGQPQLTFHLSGAEEFISNTDDSFDLVFIDPSRRNAKSNKVILLKEYEPDITLIQEQILSKTQFLLIKVSPLYDIQKGLSELKWVKNIYVVSVDNECKELLFLIERDFNDVPMINSIDLQNEGGIKSEFSFTIADESNSISELSNPLLFIYEPNASILKAGAFKIICQRFGLKKLDIHTHLYTSTDLIAEFPGKVFRVESVVKSEKDLTLNLPDKKVNIVTRNYPLKPEQIKHKYHLHDGGDKFLIGFTCQKNKCLMLCSRVIKT
jgi:16S rRNA G966 N2-methylase RsmD